MANWVRIASIADVPPGMACEVVAEDRLVAVFNVGGQFYALDGLCPHQGGPLGRGRLEGSVVTCPWHGWQFDVKTGQHQVNPRLKHPLLPVKTEGDDLFVDVSE